MLSTSPPIGTNVVVTPTDPRTGVAPVTIAFAEVTATGITSVASAGSGPAPPDGFRVREAYYELETTARFTSAEICFRHAAGLAPAVAQLVDGRWTSLPTSQASSREVRANVSSLSRFVLLEPVRTPTRARRSLAVAVR